MKLTFLSFNEQFILQQPLENQANMRLMLSEVVGEDQYVIQVNKDEAIEKVSQDIVDQGLEYS